MKKIFLTAITFFALATGAWAQSPEAFKYQSIVRDASQMAIPNQAVGMRDRFLHEQRPSDPARSIGGLHQPQSTEPRAGGQGLIDQICRTRHNGIQRLQPPSGGYVGDPKVRRTQDLL